MAADDKVPNAGVRSVQSTFARKEKKYLLSPGQFDSLMGEIGGRLEEEPFGRSKVSSLYYDTPAFELIGRSMEKPLYKEKLRIRSYGEYDPDAAVFVELKKKFKGIVYKRRVRMAERAAYLFMGGRPYEQACRAYPLHPRVEDEGASCISIQVEQQIAHEIEACICRYPGLTPSMMVVVDRLPLHTVDGNDVRITFDIDPRYRCEGLAFSQRLAGDPIFPDGEVVMEVKCQAAYPLWLVRALDRVGAYCRSCSKYGTAYQLMRSGQPTHVVHHIDSRNPPSAFSSLFSSPERLAHGT